MPVTKRITFASSKVIYFVCNLVLDRLIAFIPFLILAITELTGHETLTSCIMLVKPLNAIMIPINTIFSNCFAISIAPFLFMINYIRELPIRVRFWETLCLSFLLIRTNKLDGRGFCNPTATFIKIPRSCSLTRCFWCTSLAREVHHAPKNFPLFEAEMIICTICIT